MICITGNCPAGRASMYLIDLRHSENDILARQNLASSQVQLLIHRYWKVAEVSLSPHHSY